MRSNCNRVEIRVNELEDKFEYFKLKLIDNFYKNLKVFILV